LREIAQLNRLLVTLADGFELVHQLVELIQVQLLLGIGHCHIRVGVNLDHQPVGAADPRHPRHDPRYAGLDAPPAAESLKDTLVRVQPYWESRIAPDVRAGRCTLVSAHGNSLRALVKLLENISDDDIVRLEIPTGAPLLYEFGPGFTARPRRYVGEGQ